MLELLSYLKTKNLHNLAELYLPIKTPTYRLSEYFTLILKIAFSVFWKSFLIVKENQSLPYTLQSINR